MSKLTSLGRSSMCMGMEAILGKSIVVVVMYCKEAIRPAWRAELGVMDDEESESEYGRLSGGKI